MRFSLSPVRMPANQGRSFSLWCCWGMGRMVPSGSSSQHICALSSARSTSLLRKYLYPTPPLYPLSPWGGSNTSGDVFGTQGRAVAVLPRAGTKQKHLCVCVCAVGWRVCMCVCVTPKSFKSCSNCEVQQIRPTTKRPNHEFLSSCVSSSGVCANCSAAGVVFHAFSSCLWQFSGNCSGTS